MIFVILGLGIPIIMGLIVGILVKKRPEKKFKIMSITVAIGCFFIGLIAGIITRLPLLWVIIMGLIASILGGLWPIGFWMMKNDALTKAGLMKESQRKSEEEEIRKEIRDVLGVDKKKGPESNDRKQH